MDQAYHRRKQLHLVNPFAPFFIYFFTTITLLIPAGLPAKACDRYTWPSSSHSGHDRSGPCHLLPIPVRSMDQLHFRFGQVHSKVGVGIIKIELSVAGPERWSPYNLTVSGNRKCSNGGCRFRVLSYECPVYEILRVKNWQAWNVLKG